MRGRHQKVQYGYSSYSSRFVRLSVIHLLHLFCLRTHFFSHFFLYVLRTVLKFFLETIVLILLSLLSVQTSILLCLCFLETYEWW